MAASAQITCAAGPKAANVLSRVVAEDLSQLGFMVGATMTVAGVPNCGVTRCGYTGEDGFEISIPHDAAMTVAQALLAEEDVSPAGLGARDSLRLEAGLCLYGNDLDTTTSPVEAALLWTIPKARRTGGGFVGAEVIQQQIAEGATRKRVGLTIHKGAPARDGARIFAEDGETEVGVVTSGTVSPTLKKKISMGYVAKGHFKLNTPLKVEVRGKLQDATVTRMPFVPARYFKKKEVV